MKSDNLQGILAENKQKLFGYPHRKKYLSHSIKKVLHGISSITNHRSRQGNTNAVFSSTNIEGDVHQAISDFSTRFKSK